uniref:Evasin n=1 Tax=Rhipicephalus appendiculatus TaxID=34631 RepID=A0A131YGB4_RHIAP
MDASVLSAICFSCFGLAIVTTIRETYAEDVRLGNHTIKVELVSRDNKTHNISKVDLAKIFGINATNASESTLGDYDYGDLCLHDAVNSTCGVVSLGCNMTCLDEVPQPLPDGVLCTDVTLAAVKSMPNYTNFSCSLGTCSYGCCVDFNNTAICEKFPVTSVSLENKQS